MLLSLHIENLAVIKCIDLDLSSGFMALTGETGAGKSVIIDAISLLLGAKADKELVRNGEPFGMVSGVFASFSKSTAELLTDLGIDISDGEILIQRTVYSDGRSSVKINGRTVTVALLKSAAQGLVSIHGQSDTASLSDLKKQLELIDTYAANDALLAEYTARFSQLEQIRKEIRTISEKESERVRLVEMLEYQISDIDSYALTDGEEDALIERKLKIKNSEKITKNAGFAFKALKGSEKGSVSFLLDRSASALEQISDVIPDFGKYAEALRDVLYQVDDIAEEVYAAISDMEDAPEEKLNEIESRLDKISKLKRKYGYTVKDILEFRDKAKAELETLTNSENILRELTLKEEAAYEAALKIADELHERRIDAAKRIECEVKSTLEFLDMPKVVFFASVKEEFKNGKKQFFKDGSDIIEFFISANRGADAQPLAKVASGGELARVMLALKSVLAGKDGTGTVIFDEIDAGVSGKTARKIGIKMLSLSESIQLISVTHSAQIASLADTHFLISKSDVAGKTETAVSLLDTEGRIAELSRILGGIDVTEAQRAAAVDMLEEKKIYTHK